MSSSTTSTPVLYIADPKADVVLVSSDGVKFPIRRVCLQAASEVFDDMFDTASAQAGEKDGQTDLPVVKLDDTAEELDLILRLIVRGQQIPTIPGLPAEQTLWSVPILQ